MVLASRQEPSLAGGPSVANGFSHAATAAAASMASILPRRILCHPSCKAVASPASSSPSLIPLNSMEPLASQHEADQSSGMHHESSPQLQSIPVRRIGAGLANLGNTCFLNSVLQCLTYTPPLAAHLQGGLHKSSCQVTGFCAMCALESHVKEALASHGRIVSPTYLVKNLRCISRSFQMWRQEDAHEYMRYLIEALQKCCSVELSGGKSLIQSVFGGRLRSQVKCTQCSHCSNTYDPFLDLSLEVMRADSLQKALARFTAVEVLDGDNKYQCSKCKTKVRALKQFTVDKAPPVLTVQFKRFSSSGAFGGKIDKKVHFDRTLDLKSFVNGGEDENLKYSLYAVLVHSGWSTHSGHYYCFVRTAMDKWHVMDDSQVSQVSERTVLEQKAYILFYVRDTKVTTLLNTDQCHGSNRDTSIAADLQVNGSLKRNGVSSETASAEAKGNLSTETVLETNGVSSITAFAEVYENLDTVEVLETNGGSSITAFAEVYENLDTDEVLKAWVSNGLSQSSWYNAVKIINSSCLDPDITVENQSVELGCPRHVEDGAEKTQLIANTKCAEDDTCRGDFSDEHSENGQKSGCDSDELPVPESGGKESRCLHFDVAAPIARNTFFEAAGQRALRILCMCAKFCFWSCFWSPL